jgi:hypothetical protein
LWQQSLRSDEDLPTFGRGKDPRNELMSLVNDSFEQLQKSGRRQPRSPRETRPSRLLESDSSKQKFIEKVVRRALETGRKEGEQVRKSEVGEVYRRVETEGAQGGSRSASPQQSDRPASPSEGRSPSSTRRLAEELKAAHEKNRKLEEMYATLLSRKGPGPDTYKKKYEDLQQLHTRDEVSSIQAQWTNKNRVLQQQLEEKTEECRRLTLQLQQISSLTPLLRLQQDLEELKHRVTRTEKDNEVLKTKVPQ